MLQQTLIWAFVCVAALGLCLWRPHRGRVVLGIFFILMAVGVNVVLVLIAPDKFVGLGTDAPLLPFYRWGFEHVVAKAPAVFGLLAAAFESTIGLLLIKGGRRTEWGLIGGIVFLLAITPLSVWTLPNPIMAAALGVILWRRRTEARLLSDASRPPVVAVSGAL
jgi:uncharacterized membrane protein YkgB